MTARTETGFGVERERERDEIGHVQKYFYPVLAF